MRVPPCGLADRFPAATSGSGCGRHGGLTGHPPEKWDPKAFQKIRAAHAPSRVLAHAPSFAPRRCGGTREPKVHVTALSSSYSTNQGGEESYYHVRESAATLISQNSERESDVTVRGQDDTRAQLSNATFICRPVHPQTTRHMATEPKFFPPWRP